MRKVGIEKVKSGDVLAKTIYTLDGKVLLRGGTTLESATIQMIQNYFISDILVEDKLSQDIIIEDIVLEETRVEAKKTLSAMLDSYTKSNILKTDEIKRIVDLLISNLFESNDILINLSDIRSIDQYIFEHSINVCIISLLIGIHLKYSQQNLRELGVGAILHDIGKLKISEEILKKPSHLTDEEYLEIKKHSAYGYQILKYQDQFSEESIRVVHEHHERIDGTGYPKGLVGSEISDFAKIVAVADVFDALTTDRVYRKKIHPYDVIKYMYQKDNAHFEHKVIQVFKEIVSIYPLGTGVILSSNERGIVVSVNKNNPTRPVVRIVFDQQNKKLANYFDIDLSQRMDLEITQYFDF